jgi:hypothetical protein
MTSLSLFTRTAIFFAFLLRHDANICRLPLFSKDPFKLVSDRVTGEPSLVTVNEDKNTNNVYDCYMVMLN